MQEPPSEVLSRLELSPNIWFASVRPNGQPHLTPVWFIVHAGRLYVSIDPHSVKSRNLAHNPKVTLALEDGSHPVICEGQAAILSKPYPQEVAVLFQKKYDWDINNEGKYGQLVEIRPRKWLSW
jgi:nitroimidazol reductase NimA-like FMN-containing flavoprotein (pyridoxamine 5'-phosphate oxidase superfamily)